MRKIFSAALALVCVWFATPAMANCNLFDSSWLLNINEWTESNGVYSGPTWRLILYINNNNGLPVTIDPNTQYTISATFGNNDSSFRFGAKYTDGTTEYQIGNINNGRFSFTTTAGKQVASLTATYGSGASNVELSNIQIERGDTATEYTPYNPLCATCDGTVVNYTSATGTGVQNGTPTPTNPIEPTFYKQGNMVLRKVGNIADSYDASTGKITRRVGVKVLDGSEDFSVSTNSDIVLDGSTTFWNVGAISDNRGVSASAEAIGISNYFVPAPSSAGRTDPKIPDSFSVGSNAHAEHTLWIRMNGEHSAAEFKSWLAAQKAAGTPVTVYYPLATAVEEDWTETSYCETPIKIATTKYNETKFSPLNTALANAISVVDTVVSNTITQAGRIATLQAQKQTRPADDPSDANNAENCPAGKKCLLVEDASGTPHWYEIVERYSRLPDGYTELEYIESTGTQYIDTGLNPKPDVTSVEFEAAITDTSMEQIFGARQTAGAAGGSYNVFANVSPKQFRLDWVGNADAVVGGIVVGTFYKFVLNADGSVDFQNEHFGRAETKTECNYNMYLFGANNAGVYTENSLGKVRYKGAVKIKERGILVRDFIPAKNASGVVGMYDTVSGQFFTNQGTGEFVAGPVAE